LEEPVSPESQLILILDDEVMITDGLAIALERDGRTIITCNDIESAEIILERMKPSHVVADIHISGPFGFEGLDFIGYAKQHSPETRIILISGDAPDAVQLEGAERGAVAFLRKPFELRELDSMLNIISASALSSGAHAARLIRMPLLDEILESDHLNPFFQPIVRLGAAERPYVGYESLARYRSDSPLRNPEVLFRYAARKERLVDLEFACATRTLATGAPLVHEGAVLFVNVHPQTFASSRLSDMLAETAEASHVPLRCVVLEITEQGRLGESPSVLETFARLQAMGVRFAFDDLGIAYSHLPFIDKVRPSFLKVSQHFGTDFETNATKQKIVNNLLSLARDFKCELILEGIESEATAQAAFDLGITYGQGFHFGSPADVAIFRKSSRLMSLR
jgi:EAL domain-containing protein (putative c-di-GMP-specific phosphodiesterase class I)/ActR/RegA family two-component response regulator